jgi:hypothetical protein
MATQPLPDADRASVFLAIEHVNVRYWVESSDSEVNAKIVEQVHPG